MSRYCPAILTVLFLLVSCTRPTPVSEKPEDIYRYAWEYPDSALKSLQGIKDSHQAAGEKMLCRLVYGIAGPRTGTGETAPDLTDVIGHYRYTGEKSYLFVAIVLQAQLHGRSNQLKEALELLQEATALPVVHVPMRARSLYHSIYAFVLRRSGNYTDALEHYVRSQSINLSEGYSDLAVSNAINIVNLPGAVSTDTLDRFIALYEPHLKKADAEMRGKFYNNVGNELKRGGDTLSAMAMYRKVLDMDQEGNAVRTRLNYAQLLDHYGHTEKAESIYSIVFRHADSTITQRLYHHLTTRAMESGNIRQARRYMNIYLRAVNHIYATRDRKELLEMQAKYERSELMRTAEHNRNTVLKCLLSFVAISILGYVVYALSRIYQCYRLGRFLDEYCRLTGEYRTAIHAVKGNERSAAIRNREYRQRLSELTERIGELMKESNRFRTIYRIKTQYMTVTPQDISALNLYLQLNGGKMKYVASQHRITLYHWLNLTDNRFAERFSMAYPQLSQHDMDLCCFYRLGFDNDHISGLYGQYSDSIRRHRLRLYPLLKVEDKESLYYLIQSF